MNPLRTAVRPLFASLLIFHFDSLQHPANIYLCFEKEKNSTARHQGTGKHCYDGRAECPFASGRQAFWHSQIGPLCQDRWGRACGLLTWDMADKTEKRREEINTDADITVLSDSLGNI